MAFIMMPSKENNTCTTAMIGEHKASADESLEWDFSQEKRGGILFFKHAVERTSDSS